VPDSQDGGSASVDQFMTITCAQVARVALHPQKVFKEAACPVRGPAFAFATMCLLVLCAGVVLDQGDDGKWHKVAKALFWAAAPLQLALAFLAVANWVFYLHEWEHISPTWLAVPLTNVFGAIAWALVYRKAPGSGARSTHLSCKLLHCLQSHLCAHGTMPA
jgi:tellurite resistance protein TehA-like permease